MSDATTALSPAVRAALVARLTALADDELTLAHRDAEWTGHAPLLEEDIALANLAQDELGHAMLWLDLRAGLDGSDPDALAFRRDAAFWRNLPLTEQPRGDWAFTMIRQYLFDAWELRWLAAARGSAWAPLAEAAGQAVREERFHLEHSAQWVEQLGLGTEESQRRAQNALDELWPLALQLPERVPGEEAAIHDGLLPDPEALRGDWLHAVTGHLTRCGLNMPQNEVTPFNRETHSPHLTELLAEFQAVARTDPEAVRW